MKYLFIILIVAVIVRCDYIWLKSKQIYYKCKKTQNISKNCGV